MSTTFVVCTDIAVRRNKQPWQLQVLLPLCWEAAVGVEALSVFGKHVLPVMPLQC